jgi:O-antigen/teichoic acid export membrane protein
MQGQALRLRHWLTSRPSYVKAMRPKAWALFVVSLFVFASADVVMLLAGMMLPPADVAVVGITVRLAALAGFILQAAQLFVMPDYAKAVVDADVQATHTVLLRVNLTTIAASIAAIIGAIILGEFALSLFGSDYVAGATLLILLLIGQMVRALAGLNQSLLALKGHQLRSTVSCIIAVTFLVTTMVLFTKHWGAIGVGYAVIASECAWALSLAAQAQSLCHQRADLFWLVMNGRGKESGH